jgi:hypothetical protein
VGARNLRERWTFPMVARLLPRFAAGYLELDTALASRVSRV